MEQIAETPCCTAQEVEAAIAAAKKAFPAWRDTPCAKRVEVLYTFRDLLVSHIDEFTYMVCRENGKNWEESKVVTTRWFTEEESENTKVDTWDRGL
jgi:malonate-semialdehyde dehydrogenase (acetylating)/methylmalonate-semialdehyde dehydrogenase